MSLQTPTHSPIHHPFPWDRFNFVIPSIDPTPNNSPAVSIVEPEGISPMMLGETKYIADDFNLDRSVPKQHRAKVASKLKGRKSIERMTSPRLTAQRSYPQSSGRSDVSVSTSRSRQYSAGRELHAQISAWLEHEKQRRAEAKAKKEETTAPFKPSDILAKKTDASPKLTTDEARGNRSRRASGASESHDALEELQDILGRYMTLEAQESFHGFRGSRGPSRRSSVKKLRRQSTAYSSDTDYFDGEPIIPSCDAWLDNSKTLAYSGGTTEAPSDSPNLTRRSKEKQAWTTFKYEIVRLTHTLRLKGWRRVSMEHSHEIEVERLSGALTNAVYVVSPPKDMSHHTSKEKVESTHRRPPPKLLLRIYGPQVDHLIDRVSELAILRRLGRKNIGPRLLGTFTNGRFEQFLDSKTLKPNDLRVPETSRQIAKRMKELHEGIDLTDEERQGGPFVWKNWDKWLERCEVVVKWVDGQQALARERRPSLVRRGSQIGDELVCGVEWDVFRQTVEKYKRWLEEKYGGKEKLKERLVFAHNDTQYGNILRLQPPGDSPLLKPSNQHKQLVVIDFEYANANTPGLEFANHFTEWCYDYHDKLAPFACSTARYPTPEEQYRFVKAYVLHRPSFLPVKSDTPASTPGLEPRKVGSEAKLGQSFSMGSTSSLAGFMLDARTPGATPGALGPDLEKIAEEEEKRVEKEVKKLLKETKMWRLANSAMWVAWGIVQAKVEGMPEDDPASAVNGETEHTNGGAMVPNSDPLSPEAKDMVNDLKDKRPDEMRSDEAEDGDEDEFDYLAYAHERALFFWGDAIQAGLVKEEQLPEALRRKVKAVEY
ncbi:kinase-like protein [Rhizodiscina lignyota]|uniref:Kinase-like protein n=1 Tax=Rhizodiscina lignyota TaxID=1504668 RepID=A0A9P4M418_9PEZI|nr:kinase-like protein [Rhizodiscina lignyota]